MLDSDEPPPSLHEHYTRFITTTRRSAPVLSICTLALAVVAAWVSPLTSERQLSVSYRSLIELRVAYTPDAALAAFRKAPELIPEVVSAPDFDTPKPISTLLQRFAYARLSLSLSLSLFHKREIDLGLSEAESRIWHAHPVWFLDGNPIVGYSKLKDCIRLLFWSGQSFETPGLSPEGSFKAGEARYTSSEQIDQALLRRWIDEAKVVQWDYRNIAKR